MTERQAEIIEKSIDLIAEKGIQGLTIKNLSKRIGISEPAIYRHFESKNEIILALLNTFNDMSIMFSSMMQTFEGTALEKIRFMFTKMIEIFIENPSMVAVIFSEELFKNEDILNDRVKIIQNRNQETIENILEQGKIIKDIRNDIDTRYLAILVMGALRFLVNKWNLNDKNFDLEAEGKELLNSIQLLLKN
jgi:AcrR family transcriptional regulator